MYLISKKNKVLYKNIRNNEYQNLATGVVGVLEDNQVALYLDLLVIYNYIFLKYPFLFDLIETLQMDAIIEKDGVKLNYNFANKTLNQCN